MSRNSSIPDGVSTRRVSFRDDMAAFDKLPKCIREAIAGAAFQFSAASALRDRKASGMSAREIAARIRAFDADLVAKATPRVSP